MANPTAQPNIQLTTILASSFGVSQEDLTKAAILENLAKLGGELAQDDSLVFEGNKLILPERYEDNVQEAIDFLYAWNAQQNTVTKIDRVFKYRPYDVYHALGVVMKKMFGTTGIGRSTPSLFGSTPPSFTTIDVGFEESTQVITGATELAPLNATITIGQTTDPELGPVGHIVVKAPRKYRAHVEGFFAGIEKELKENSIYRGKAFDGADLPCFLNTGTVDPGRVIYTDDVLDQLETNIWAPLKFSEAWRKAKLPLKRSVLLYGPYGTGKSLAAALTAQIATKNGWTFIHVRPGQNLKRAMETAKLYPPAVVFFEDVDSVAEKGDPDKVSELLDVFDGIGNKNAEIIAVLTTNFVDRIPPGMLRPGRMDAVVRIGEMDRNGVERLIKATVPDDKLMEVDYDAVFEAYQGFLPAFAVEATQRAYAYAIAHSQGDAAFLTTADFVGAAKGMQTHLELMTGAKEGARTPSLDAAVKDAVRRASEGLAFVPEYEYGTASPDPSFRLTDLEAVKS